MNRFRTKVGFCHILEDRIVLNKEIEIKEGLNLKPNHSMIKFIVLYAILVVFLGFASKVHIDQDKMISAVFLGLLMLLYLYGWITCFIYSGTPVLYKKDIEKIEFNKGLPGLTRGRFSVTINLPNGKTKKRMIMMLGVLSGGKAGTAEAMKVMKEHQLYPFEKVQ
ncbi:MAG: hypothetical protein ACI857_002544 [Arenicella sp.]|jgi:hypothetical protein